MQIAAAASRDAMLAVAVREMITPMTLDEARDILEADVIVGTDLEKIDVEMGCGADLMSDVLAFTKTGALLLTGLTNAQAVRTAGHATADV